MVVSEGLDREYWRHLCWKAELGVGVMVTHGKHLWAGSFPASQLLDLPQGWEPQDWEGKGRGVDLGVDVGVAWCFWRPVSKLESPVNNWLVGL